MLQIPLNQLKPAKDNVRQVAASSSGLDALIASIKAQGLLHNLIVKKNGKGYHVIDGNRRLKALQKIHGTKGVEPVNCIEITDDDFEIGLHANMMREDMHPLDQCDVIYKLASDGAEDFASIAARFGQTYKWVEQRVSLSELSPVARDAFRNCEFNLGVAMALTLGSHERQELYLSENKDNRLSADQAKRFMLRLKVPLDYALFDTKGLVDELGIVTDLFSDEVYITDIDAFEVRQNAALEEMVNIELAKGYLDVYLLKDCYTWDSPECRNLTHTFDKDVPIADRICIIRYASRNGEVDIDGDYISKDMERIKEKEAIENGEIEAPTINPTDYSRPQQALLDGYYLEHVRDMLFEINDKTLFDEMSDAILLARRIASFTQYNTNLIGSVTIDQPSAFPLDERPEHIADSKASKYIDEWQAKYLDAFEEKGTDPLSFVMKLHTDIRTKLKFCYLSLSITKHQSQQKEFIAMTGIEPANVINWFKPDAVWLNKYKMGQLEELYARLGLKTIGYMNPSKKDYIVAIETYLGSNPDFNPFEVWSDDGTAKT